MKKKEKGQIIIILAVSLIAILGVTALAVDGSMIYRERREDQTTADSSVLSAATTAASSTTCAVARTAAITAAQNYALAQEGVTLANDSTSPNRVEATCSADNTTLDIKIVVTSNPTTTFAKMVSRNELTTKVESTARVTFGSGGTFAGGSGVWTTGTTCDGNGGIWLDGEGRITITGGGAYSASCISVNSSTSYVLSDGPIYYSGKTGTNVSTVMIGSKVVYLGIPGQFNSNGIMMANWQKSFVLTYPLLTTPSYAYQVNPTPNSAIPEAQWPIYQPTVQTLTAPPAMTPPSCTGLSDWGSPAKTTTTYNEGIYNSINVRPSSAITFNPGIYCIRPGGTVDFGSDYNITANNVYFYFQGTGTFKTSGASKKIMTMNNSKIYLTEGSFDHQQATFKGEPISIYIKQGSFYIQNGAYGSTFTAPSDGLLLNMDPANTGTFKILNGGLGQHKLSGTVYAPNALATISGGTDTTANAFQLIVKRLSMEGSGKISLDTDNGNLYSGGGSTSVELLK